MNTTIGFAGSAMAVDHTGGAELVTLHPAEVPT
jgi:hypothetical protein